MDINHNLEDSFEKFPDLRKYWGVSEYDSTHHQVLLEREANRSKLFCSSPQILHRHTLVEWMKKIAILKKLDNSSVHLAVYLLDIFMDNHKIDTERLYLVALVCILLATKFEERDVTSLRSKDLNKLMHNKYRLHDFFVLEIIILKHVKWNLFIPTTVQFINYYINYLLIEEDSMPDNYTDLWYKGKKIVIEYLDCVISDLNLMHGRPSVVACAIIASARKDMLLKTIWPTHLIYITGLNLSDFKDTIIKLRKTLKFIKNKSNN